MYGGGADGGDGGGGVCVCVWGGGGTHHFVKEVKLARCQNKSVNVQPKIIVKRRDEGMLKNLPVPKANHLKKEQTPIG